MPLLSPSAENGVCLRMRSGLNCVMLTIVPGLGRPSMASTVTRSSQKSPVTRIIGYSFLLPVIGTATTLTMLDPTAIIGHRPFLRTVRTTRSACPSIQAASAITTPSGLTADPSVLSQNKLRFELQLRFPEIEYVVNFLYLFCRESLYTIFQNPGF